MCRENGTSITAFALETGCNRSTPNGWKNGAVPNAEIVLKAAERFDVTCDYLLGRTDVRKFIGEGLTMDELNLLTHYRKASPAFRKAAHAVLNVDESE